jgi:hypothetical protein
MFVLLDEISLENQALTIIYPSLQNDASISDFFVGWWNVCRSFHLISSCDPADQSDSAYFREIKISLFRGDFP